jgi:hypothetical protein
MEMRILIALTGTMQRSLEIMAYPRVADKIQFPAVLAKDCLMMQRKYCNLAIAEGRDVGTDCTHTATQMKTKQTIQLAGIQKNLVLYLRTHRVCFFRVYAAVKGSSLLTFTIRRLSVYWTPFPTPPPPGW